MTDVAGPIDVTHALTRAGLEVDSSSLQRAIYSTDASLYRIVPSAVAFPRNADDVEGAVRICAELGVPLTMRGGGTSIAGNAIGTGVVLDVSKYMNNVVAIDHEQRSATVQPGVIQADLQKRLKGTGLRFGPDPSTSNRCTIGGMIGNNACGSRALAYGRTSDNVHGLEVVTGTGHRLSVSRPVASDQAPEITASLRAIGTENQHLIRSTFGRFSRQVSGYALENLLPENSVDIAGLLAGSEGTLALTTRATVRLVVDPPVRGLIVLGYTSMAEAADAAPSVLPFAPTACEGLDARIVERVRLTHGHARVPDLPRGSGWLMVELVGQSVGDVTARAIEVAKVSSCVDSMIVTDIANAEALWRIREDGAGLASRTPDGRPAYAGWEDAAVPVQHLGQYLREFEALLVDHKLMGMPYGHFGDGCVHVRIDYPIADPGGTAIMRSFLEEAAELVTRYGGSLSGEHGDGRARGELLATMYSPDVRALFGQVKSVFDPSNILNPGVIVEPDAFDQNVRVALAPELTKRLGFRYEEDHGDFSAAVHKCVGVGKCRADIADAGGVMCPSYIATRNEKDSTRGRARVLQEMINADVVDKKWRSPEVHEALDLCLSCKGCATDCPTGVDMASYKAEVLYQSFKHRIRPRSHYSLGWLPRWARLASMRPGLVNRLTSTPGLKHLARWAAGVDQRRSLPRFARQTFREWFSSHPANTDGRHVALWVDTFTNYFDPNVGIAAVSVLERAGYRVELTDNVCCGLTWISTGQLKTAKRKLRSSMKSLDKLVDRNVPIVGLEPSCTGVLRSDATDLLGTEQAKRVSSNVNTLAEILTNTDRYEMPDLTGIKVVAQPHCHHHAVMGWSTDAQLLAAAGAEVQRLGGCCGLAGNFGVEKGHYEVSVAVAEHQLLPAARTRDENDVLLADGFSCRTQLDDLMAGRGVHLAELLDRSGNDAQPNGGLEVEQ